MMLREGLDAEDIARFIAGIAKPRRVKSNAP